MLFIKKIDIYIIKKFLGTFFFALGLIILISVVFDFSEKIDDFIEKEAPLRAIIFQYYLNFIPYFSNLFSFLFVFIAVIFFTSKMAMHTEIIAILSCGISYRRIMVPYFVGATIIALLTFYLGHYVIPRSNVVRMRFEEKYFKKHYRSPEKNIHRQIAPGVFIYIDTYNDRADVGTRFSMETIKDGKLISKMTADHIQWDTSKQQWHLNKYWVREIGDLKETITEGVDLDTTLNLFPEEFKRPHTIVESMTTPDLRNFIREELSRGKSDTYYFIELYRRTAAPFAVYILTLIGVSLSSRKSRGGMGMHIGFGIALSFSYILFMQVSKEFSVSGDLKPLVAVWIPNMLFAVIALVLYKIAPK